ncbi:MAG: AAA family ATPase [Chitinophagaceae bacterium]|nr:AAA family ATPase [Chitinophagaceae bacterium]
MKLRRPHPAAEAESIINNLEILYVYIKDFKNLNHIQLNFSGHRSYHLEKNEDDFILSCRENKKYPDSIFPIPMHSLLQEGVGQVRIDKTINNVTAIIGQNGAGKSNILEYLTRILTNNLYVNEESLIILKVEGVIKAFNSFAKPILLQDGLDIEIIQSIEEISYRERESLLEGDEGKRHVTLAIPYLQNSKVVFYSPQADFQSFPFNFDDPAYNDISTNYLLEYDHGKGEEYAKSDFDKILSHKSQTVRRFIDLIYSSLPLPKDINDFIPQSTYIQINRLISPEEKSRNLNYQDKEFKKQFIKKLQDNWNAADKLRRNENQNEYYKRQAKTELSYSLINHFLINKEDEFGADTLIEAEAIDWDMSMEEIIRYYFENQKWKASSIYLLIYDSLISAIDISEEFSDFGSESFSFRVDKNVDLVTLYSNYLNYELLYEDTNHPSGLLDFYWRGISSGEKTLLDLFSRLLHAKSQGFANAGSLYGQDDRAINTVFLLIDEGEIGFHPQWQKNYLKYLIDFLKYAYSNLNVQLILTSHSPFLISDLPRENVIFLQKEGDNSIVSDPQTLNRTFGGNIHEMLIDSFFLEDGIIGAFAQERINELISEILSETVIPPERIIELKNIIESIGEHVVRVKLLHMLTEKKLKDSL